MKSYCLEGCQWDLFLKLLREYDQPDPEGVETCTALETYEKHKSEIEDACGTAVANTIHGLKTYIPWIEQCSFTYIPGFESHEDIIRCQSGEKVKDILFAPKDGMWHSLGLSYVLQLIEEKTHESSQWSFPIPKGQEQAALDFVTEKALQLPDIANALLDYVSSANYVEVCLTEKDVLLRNFDIYELRNGLLRKWSKFLSDLHKNTLAYGDDMMMLLMVSASESDVSGFDLLMKLVLLD